MNYKDRMFWENEWKENPHNVRSSDSNLFYVNEKKFWMLDVET